MQMHLFIETAVYTGLSHTPSVYFVCLNTLMHTGTTNDTHRAPNESTHWPVRNVCYSILDILFYIYWPFASVVQI